MARPALIRRKGALTAGSPRRVRGNVQTAKQIRALRASAIQLKPGDVEQARIMKRIRQPWQELAWAFRDEIGELRYATNYMGNGARRMLLYPAVFQNKKRLPVPVEESDQKQYAAAMHEALDRLGDIEARGHILGNQMENFEIAGECFLVGRDDLDTGEEIWEIRSISEVDVDESGRIFIRDLPSTPTVGGVPSLPRWGQSDIHVLSDTDFISRLWWPHPRYRAMADSPVRGALDILEELSLLSKDVRASALSRLVNNGMFLLPDTLTVNRADGGDEDGESEDPFLMELTELAAEAIADPGSAAAALPMFVRGPVDAIKEARFLLPNRPESDNLNKRGEALNRLATSLDLPSEVLHGMADLNHWTAWQVSEDTFRTHLEPTIQVLVDALTVGYYRTYLKAAGVPDEVVAQSVVWYDPVQLVTKPDRTQDAKDAWDRDSISMKALRGYMGFTDEDAPSDEEQVLRILLRARTIDPSVTNEVIRQLWPEVVPVATATAPEVEPYPQGPPGSDNPVDTQPPPPQADQPRGVPGPPPATTPPQPSLPGRRASAAVLAGARAPSQQRPVLGEHSRSLIELDRELRATVRTMAEAAAVRGLERAGARVVTKARNSHSKVILSSCERLRHYSVPGHLGPALVASLGLGPTDLVDRDFADLDERFNHAVETAQRSAVHRIGLIAGTPGPVVWLQLSRDFENARVQAWEFLRVQLAGVIEQAMEKDPAQQIRESVLVSTGLIRAALAIAGGFQTETSAGIGPDLRPVRSSELFGQIGTGTIATRYLLSVGAEVDQFQWIHGSSANPFEPHLALAGQQFSALQIEQGLDYAPGDHSGCGCDLFQIWRAPVERVA